MTTKIVIVTGYDNKLTQSDIQTIKDLKACNHGKQYEWSLLYYIPPIPATCLIETTFRAIERHYRDKAKATLQCLSQALDISLPIKNTLTHYNRVIELGSTAAINSVKRRGISIILTNNPHQLKFDIFDQLMHWIKSTWLWHYVASEWVQSRPRSQAVVMTPKQLIEQAQAPCDCNKPFAEKNSKEILSIEKIAKAWRKIVYRFGLDRKNRDY